MSPVRAPLIAPVLVTLDRLAPDSMRMPVAWEAALVVETPEMRPSFLSVGMVTPARIWMAVPLAWKPWPETVLDEVTWMPPAMVTRWPFEPPIWMAVPEWPSKTPLPVTPPSMIRP